MIPVRIVIWLIVSAARLIRQHIESLSVCRPDVNKAYTSRSFFCSMFSSYKWLNVFSWGIIMKLAINFFE
jgi:hypothetical protein